MRAARRGLAVLAVLAAASAAVLVGLLPLFGFRVLVVRGASMGAAAPLGSVVVGERRPASAVGVGDVIVMRPVAEGRRGAPVMHRVVGLRVVDGQRVVTTKGDANAAPDPTEYLLSGPTVSPRWIIPGIGFVIALLATRTGFLLLVLVPAAGVTVMWLRVIWRPPSEAGRGGPVPA